MSEEQKRKRLLDFSKPVVYVDMRTIVSFGCYLSESLIAASESSLSHSEPCYSDPRGAKMEPFTVNKLPSKEERAKIGQAAREIYESLREELERSRWGEYVAINVENGDYTIAADHKGAVQEIQKKYPGILPFVIRVGYRAVYHFGGSGLSDGKRP